MLFSQREADGFDFGFVEKDSRPRARAPTYFLIFRVTVVHSSVD